MSAVNTPFSHSTDTFVAPVCNDAVATLYQDDDILLIDKPSGLLSLSAKNPLNWDSVHYRLVHGQEGVSAAFADARLPQRLDFGTSGIMVVGLHSESTRHLNKQFANGTIKKRYFAMLDGWLSDDKGQINAAIGKGKNLFPRVNICNSTGKEAISEYTVIERLENPQRTLVQYIPLTGRTHQLRIHSLEIGHPILGCDLYGNEQSEQLADRLLLHASDLYFTHPSSGEPMHGHSPCPFGNNEP